MLPIMRRPRFWAWTLTLTAALLAVVWVGSMKTQLLFFPTHRHVFGWNYGGVMLIVFRGGNGFPPGTKPTTTWEVRGQARVIWWPSLTSSGTASGGQSNVLIPLWPFVLLTGVPGVWMLIKTRKHTNPNACPACGYDRTGLPQSPTGPAPCPECGKSA